VMEHPTGVRPLALGLRPVPAAGSGTAARSRGQNTKTCRGGIERRIRDYPGVRPEEHSDPVRYHFRWNRIVPRGTPG